MSILLFPLVRAIDIMEEKNIERPLIVHITMDHEYISTQEVPGI